MNRRILLAVLAGAVLAACTTTPAASTAAPAAAKSVQVMAAVAPRTPVGVALTSTPWVIPTSSRHSAFPSVAQAPDGSLTMVWRGATDHVQSRDGTIRIASSRDLGRTWTGEYIVPVTGFTGRDLRDPSVSYVADQDGVHRYITFFTGSAGNPAEGAWVMRDQQPPVRIDPGFPYAAISAPVLKLPNGQLGVAFYAKKPGETVVTAWMGWSSDSGQTWSTNRILNDGVDHAEPVLVIRNGVVHLIARGGSDTLVMRSSTNSGASGSWNDPAVIVGACTGRPSAYVTAAGTMLVVCRGILNSLNAQVAYSLNGGQKWWWGPLILPAGGGAGMTYAAMTEVLPGVVHVVAGMEQVDGSAALSGAYLAEVV